MTKEERAAAREAIAALGDGARITDFHARRFAAFARQWFAAALDALEAAEEKLQSLREEVCAEAQIVGYYGEEVDSALFRSAIQQAEPRMLAAEDQAAKLRAELATLKTHSAAQAETVAELNGTLLMIEKDLVSATGIVGVNEALATLLATASYPGHYISTYCQDGRHENCRLSRKTTGEPCLCSCGHPGAGERLPTYDELKEANAKYAAWFAANVWKSGIGDYTVIMARKDEQLKQAEAEITRKDAEYRNLEFQAETATRGLESVAAKNQALRAEVERLTKALQDISVLSPAQPKPDCHVNRLSSAGCSLGTKGCVLDHGSEAPEKWARNAEIVKRGKDA